MTAPNWKAKHVYTKSSLPEKLTPGRAYFVDDQQIIVVDHGSGPKEYGGRPGPQGMPGRPIPELQGQINELAQASIRNTAMLWDMLSQHKADTQALTDASLIHTKIASDNIRDIHALSEAIILLSCQINHHENVLQDLTKAIMLNTMTLYDFMKNTKNDINALISGSISHSRLLWKLSQERDNTGGLSLERYEELKGLILQARQEHDDAKDLSLERYEELKELIVQEQEARKNSTASLAALIAALTGGNIQQGNSNIDALAQTGEILTSKDGNSYLVTESYTDQDSGVIVLTPYDNSTTEQVNVIKEGDTITYNGGSFTVNHVSASNGQGVIAIIIYPDE